MEGPAIVGPILGDAFPYGTIREMNGSLYVAQTSAEQDIAPELADLTGEAPMTLRREALDRLTGPYFDGGYDLPYGEIGRRLGFADPIEAPEIDDDEVSQLAQFFDEDDVAALSARIRSNMNRSLGSPRELLGRIDTIRAEAVLRYSSSLSFRGASGGIDPDSARAGLFFGPRRFVATRDGSLIVIDQENVFNPDRVLGFSFGSTSGWRVNEAEVSVRSGE